MAITLKYFNILSYYFNKTSNLLEDKKCVIYKE